ncbi:hypothetical protein FHS86_000368 [Roseimarinus sediminis]|jgi:hypothetical protein
MSVISDMQYFLLLWPFVEAFHPFDAASPIKQGE